MANLSALLACGHMPSSGAELVQAIMLSAVRADSSSERRRRALLDNGEQGDADTEQGFIQAQAPAERLPDPPQSAQRNTGSGRAPDAQPSARQSEADNGAADPVWDDWAWGGGNAAGRYQQQRTAASSNRCSRLQIVRLQQVRRHGKSHIQTAAT